MLNNDTVLYNQPETLCSNLGFLDNLQRRHVNIPWHYPMLNLTVFGLNFLFVCFLYMYKIVAKLWVDFNYNIHRIHKNGRCAEEVWGELSATWS